MLLALDDIDFSVEASQEIDILGDAYEYMISQFAAGAGKKAGEFYTPQEVSRILAEIVSIGHQRLRNVYDPTCGSAHCFFVLQVLEMRLIFTDRKRIRRLQPRQNEYVASRYQIQQFQD